MQMYHIPTVVAPSEYTGQLVIWEGNTFSKSVVLELHYMNLTTCDLFYLSINWSVENRPMTINNDP